MSEPEVTEMAPDNTMGSVAVVDRGYRPSPLALLNEGEFKTRMAQAELEISRLREIQISIMKPDVDYGIIPGTTKPTLFQPGAQILNRFAGYTPDYDVHFTGCDDDGGPAIGYRVCCRLYNAAGDRMGEGYGSSNSWEKKHRYRYNDRECPECHANAIFKQRGGSGYYCWKKRGGCGEEFEGKAAIKEIESQPSMIENPDQHELDNTCLKMACKRALIAATVNAHACSGQFSQDAPDPSELGDDNVAPQDAAKAQSSGPPKANRTTDTSPISEAQVTLAYTKLSSRFKELGWTTDQEARHNAIEYMCDALKVSDHEGELINKFEGLPKNVFNKVLNAIGALGQDEKPA